MVVFLTKLRFVLHYCFYVVDIPVFILKEKENLSFPRGQEDVLISVFFDYTLSCCFADFEAS